MNQTSYNPDKFGTYLSHPGAVPDHRYLLCELHSVGARRRQLLQHDQAVLQTAESGVCMGVKALRKSIGMSGLMVLRPVINEKTVDEWVMEEQL